MFSSVSLPRQARSSSSSPLRPLSACQPSRAALSCEGGREGGREGGVNSKNKVLSAPLSSSHHSLKTTPPFLPPSLPPSLPVAVAPVVLFPCLPAP